jgi:lysophospholipase L1-like esterase
VQPHGWADVLARRFAAAKKPVAVVSAGIGGNRVLRDGWGPAALARADRDVFAVPGVSHVILLEGINDIGMAGQSMFGIEPALDLAELTAGYSQIAARANARGLKIYVGTLTPMRGAPYFSEDKERLRLAANAWIRASKLFDGVIDFEAALRDPAAPDRLAAPYDSGDHLHPNDAGYKAMGDAIDLAKFR